VAHGGRGPLGPFGLGRHMHQVAVVDVAGAVFIGREEEFRNEHRRVGELGQPVEVVGGHPAVGGVDVVVGGQHVEEPARGQDRVLVVVERQSVAHDQPARVHGPQRLEHQFVVAPGAGGGHLVDERDAPAAGPQLEFRAALLEVFEGVVAGGRHEVGQELVPLALVVVVDHAPDMALGVAGPFVAEVPLEQRRVPPAHFVVREVADDRRIVAVGRGQFPGLGNGQLQGVGGEGVEPVQPGVAAQIDLGDHGQGHGPGRVGPAAPGVESPGVEARLGVGGPGGLVGVEVLEIVAPVPGFLVAAVDGVDAHGEKARSAGQGEPPHAAVADRAEALGRPGRSRPGQDGEAKQGHKPREQETKGFQHVRHNGGRGCG